MRILYPELYLHRVTDISTALLEKLGVSALLLDLDNTLTTHNNPVPDSAVLVWMEEMKAAGIHLVLVSNNKKRRVLPFAKQLGLDFTANAMKPLPFGFSRTASRLGLAARQTAVVGDQVFTDVLGGNLFGAPTILVQPMYPEEGPLFRFKRKLEAHVLRKYKKNNNKP